MSVTTLVDFEDIYTAVLSELKIPTTDGTTITRIKQDINMVYLNHVIPFKPRAWWWLEKKESVVTYEKVDAGTVSVTAGSTTVTFSSAPAASLTGYWFKTAGHPEVIKIASHTAGASTATLDTAWPLATVTGGSYKCWKDFASLSSTMKDVIQITHARVNEPLDLIRSSSFDERVARNPEYEGYPTIVNAYDFDSAGNRQIRWFPSCWDTKVVLKIEGRQEALPLSADADEPLMPVEDRIVIFYGACSRAWSRERNEREANRNWNLFMMKLGEMAAKGGEGPVKTQMRVDEDYLVNKRYRRYYRRGYGNWRSSD